MIEFTRLFLVNNMFTILLLVMFAGFFAIISKKARTAIIFFSVILTASYGLLVVNKYTHAFVWFHDAVFASMKISYAIINEINSILYEIRSILRYLSFAFYLSSRVINVIIYNPNMLVFVIDFNLHNIRCDVEYIDNENTNYEFINEENVFNKFAILRL